VFFKGLQRQGAEEQEVANDYVEDFYFSYFVEIVFL
jgi:hypothetical protein